MDTFVSLENLVKGNIVWNKQKWPEDFHSSLYEELSYFTVIDEPFWNRLLRELAAWGATRPIPINIINKKGFEALSALQTEYQTIRDLHMGKIPDVLEVKWDELEPLFTLADHIKGSSTPVFASKMCHFLMPTCFFVIDNAVIGVHEAYRDYWHKCQIAWRSCTQKEAVKQELLRYAVGLNSSVFPWSTKITELCLMGQNSASTPVPISIPTSIKIMSGTKIKIGDVLVSHRQGYHHVVISIRENLADILWLERVEGEPARFYHYVRQIKIDNALSYYGHIPADKLDRSMYRKPNEGWSKE